MITVPIRDFKSRLSYWIKESQKQNIAVTNWGNVVTTLVSPDQNQEKQIELLNAYIKELEAKVTPNATISVNNVVTTSEIKEEVSDEGEGGKCELCNKTTTIFERVVPTYNPQTGEMDDLKKKICKRCVGNLNRVLNQ
jgi:hypothetical protein